MRLEFTSAYTVLTGLGRAIAVLKPLAAVRRLFGAFAFPLLCRHPLKILGLAKEKFFAVQVAYMPTNIILCQAYTAQNLGKFYLSRRVPLKTEPIPAYNVMGSSCFKAIMLSETGKLSPPFKYAAFRRRHAAMKFRRAAHDQINTRLYSSFAAFYILN